MTQSRQHFRQQCRSFSRLQTKIHRRREEFLINNYPNCEGYNLKKQLRTLERSIDVGGDGMKVDGMEQPDVDCDDYLVNLVKKRRQLETKELEEKSKKISSICGLRGSHGNWIKTPFNINKLGQLEGENSQQTEWWNLREEQIDDRFIEELRRIRWKEEVEEVKNPLPLLLSSSSNPDAIGSPPEHHDPRETMMSYVIEEHSRVLEGVRASTPYADAFRLDHIKKLVRRKDVNTPHFELGKRNIIKRDNPEFMERSMEIEHRKMQLRESVIQLQESREESSKTSRMLVVKEPTGEPRSGRRSRQKSISKIQSLELQESRRKAGDIAKLLQEDEVIKKVREDEVIKKVREDEIALENEIQSKKLEEGMSPWKHLRISGLYDVFALSSKNTEIEWMDLNNCLIPKTLVRMESDSSIIVQNIDSVSSNSIYIPRSIFDCVTHTRRIGAIFDTSFRQIITITGRDSGIVCNHFLTCDVSKLKNYDAKYMGIVDTKAKLLDLGWCLKLPAHIDTKEIFLSTIQNENPTIIYGASNNSSTYRRTCCVKEEEDDVNEEEGLFGSLLGRNKTLAKRKQDVGTTPNVDSSTSTADTSTTNTSTADTSTTNTSTADTSTTTAVVAAGRGSSYVLVLDGADYKQLFNYMSGYISYAKQTGLDVNIDGVVDDSSGSFTSCVSNPPPSLEICGPHYAMKISETLERLGGRIEMMTADNSTDGMNPVSDPDFFRHMPKSSCVRVVDRDNNPIYLTKGSLLGESGMVVFGNVEAMRGFAKASLAGNGSSNNASNESTSNNSLTLSSKNPPLLTLGSYLPYEILRTEAGHCRMGSSININKGGNTSGVGSSSSSGPSLTGDFPPGTITPIRAGLSWLIDQNKLRNHTMFGHQALFRELASSPNFRLVGLILSDGSAGKASSNSSKDSEDLQTSSDSSNECGSSSVGSGISYPGCKIFSYSGGSRRVVGECKSSFWSPHLGLRIALAELRPQYAQAGTRVLINVLYDLPTWRMKRETITYLLKQRGLRQSYRKLSRATVVDLPFVRESREGS